MYFYLIIAACVVIDLATKIAIRMNLDFGERTEILGGFVRLVHIANTGSTGKMFQGGGRVLAIVVILVIGLALYLRRRGKFRGAAMQIGLALFIGGALGNAIDRIVYNQVTDFLFLSETSIMNFADISVFAGGLTILATQTARYFKASNAIRSNTR